jgi:host factor-I protein
MPSNALRHRGKTAASGETGQEALYLRFLSEKQVPVEVKLRDGEIVQGWIEYFDDSMIRLTREGQPNLFIYKGQIRTISEPVRRDESKRRALARKAGNHVPSTRELPTLQMPHPATESNS